MEEGTKNSEGCVGGAMGCNHILKKILGKKHLLFPQLELETLPPRTMLLLLDAEV